MDDTICLEKYLYDLEIRYKSHYENIRSFGLFDGSWYLEKHCRQMMKEIDSFISSLMNITVYLSSKAVVSHLEARIIDQSSLPFIIRTLLENDSLIDIYRHASLYLILFRLLKVLLSHRNIQMFSQNGEIVYSIRKLNEYTKRRQELSDNNIEKDILILEIQNVYKQLNHKYGGFSTFQDSFMIKQCSLFEKTLKNYRVTEVNMKDEYIGYKHSFSHEICDEKNHNIFKIRTLLNEISSMSENLPFSQSSSIFIRYDSERTDVIKALITGPSNTPYENGCFLFDIYCPRDYPNVPPYVKFLTTGRGTVNFNPNLNSDGYVCLSLLGTWKGAVNENWIPNISTLLQVLISIQSLVLNEKPYYNEHGFDELIDKHKKESEWYNSKVRKSTLKWAILENLRNPPEFFEDVIKMFYKLKEDQIKRQLEEWKLMEGGDLLVNISNNVIKELEKL